MKILTLYISTVNSHPLIWFLKVIIEYLDTLIFFSRNHKLSGHSGFEPCLCYGDILLSFIYTGQLVKPPSRPASSPVKPPPTPPQLLLPKPEHNEDTNNKQHDFIRTHFHRTTQCEFCGRKVIKSFVKICNNTDFSNLCVAVVPFLA
jgi:hypothetical protein